MLVIERGRMTRLRSGRRWCATLLVGILGAASLGACGSGGEGGSPSSGGTLTIALPGYTPESLDLVTNCLSPIFEVAYEPLIRISPTGEFEPGIAESWEYSNNNTVFTMKIRDGVKFADGTDLTADSVVDTLNYYKSVPGLNDGFLKPLTIEADGSDSVRVTHEEPWRGMESLFSTNQCNNGMVVSEAGLKNPEKLKTDMFGAGPYEYVPEESEPGDHYTYTPNPNYFDESRQNWDKIVMRVIGDPNTAFNAMATGQVQVNMTGGEQLFEQAEQKGFDITRAASYGAGIFVWDRAGEISEPLADVRVRQAMGYALDRESLAAVGGPETQPLDQLIQPGLFGADPELPTKYSYDVEKAKELLADAGYPDGFSVTMLVNSDDVQAKNILLAAVEQLKEVGIDIALEPAPETTFFTEIASKKYPLGAVSWTMLGDGKTEPDRLYKLPYSAVLNPFRSTDPDLDEAYQTVQAAGGDAALEEVTVAFNEVMTEKAWYIPVTSSPLYVYSKGVEIGESSPSGMFDVPSWTPKG
jgi:peptide/nickel transport system substrate-binding protein